METELTLRFILESVTSNETYKIGVAWGKPRHGHPEATIAEHIRELEENLEQMKWRFSSEEICKLKILIHVHDTLKVHALPRVPIEHPRSHASLAAEYLAEFTEDQGLIDMVRYHDENFALFRQYEEKGRFDEARLKRLISRISDWRLFLSFNIIDSCTKGKDRKSILWFLREMKDRVDSGVNETWIPR